MKKRKDEIGFSIVGFFLFFLTIALAATASIFIYYLANEKTNGNTWVVVFSVLGIIVFCAILCTFVDIIRRRAMVGKPVKKILDATEKIASGDFSVKLIPLHEYDRYDQYDLIFENINTMTAELNKNELLKTDFISNVSHEIKTPLAVIQNYAKALQNSNISNDKKEEYLKGLIIQTKKLSDLITNILKLNKLENQQIVPEIEEFDLAELVRVCTLGFESIIEKKQQTLEVDIDEIKIVSSESLIEIVLNNLISNAIKFTDKNGTIAISLKQENTYAVIKVKDTGCGISSQIGEHIFDKFYQGDTSHTAEGNGLGLALVKKVIDILGGEISVESKVGQGSTFVVKLKKE